MKPFSILDFRFSTGVGTARPHCGRAQALVLLALCASCLCGSAFAATSYKATLVITSVPPVGAVLSADGDARTWTNNTAAVAGKWLQTTNTMQAATTNLWQHLFLYNFTNINAIKAGTNDTWLPTNTLVFETTIDHFVSFTSLSNWCAITYTTNGGSAFIAVRGPHTNEQPTIQTQMVNVVVGILSDSRTNNRVIASAPAMLNFLGANFDVASYTNKNLIGGTNRPADFLATNGGMRNTWSSNQVATNLTGSATNLTGLNGTNFGTRTTNGTWDGGTFLGRIAAALAVLVDSVLTNNTITNAAWLDARAGVLRNFFGSNWVIHSLTVTNFSSPGTGITSFQVGDSANAAGLEAQSIGTFSEALGADSLAVGQAASAQTDFDIAIGNGAVAAGDGAISIGSGATATGQYGVSIGIASTASGDMSTALGQSATATAAHQIAIGTSTEYVSIPGEIRDVKQTNVWSTGTNRFDGAVSYSRTNITSLANGANDLDPGLRKYLKVSGPTAAYSIDKIDKGWDGRELIIQKADAYELTIPNNSGAGVLPDACKILTPNGATLTNSSSRGTIRLIYDSAASRWVVMSSI